MAEKLVIFIVAEQCQMGKSNISLFMFVNAVSSCIRYWNPAPSRAFLHVCLNIYSFSLVPGLIRVASCIIPCIPVTVMSNLLYLLYKVLTAEHVIASSS